MASCSRMWSDDGFNNDLMLAMDGPPAKRIRSVMEIPMTTFGSVSRERVMTCLSETFSVHSFRGHQEEIVAAALNRHDCLVIMPTGEGKSLCYQLPAVLTDGVTIVISPLKSLMHDQVEKLTKIGVRAAVLSTGTDRKMIFDDLNMTQPKIKLLYVTPEILINSAALKNAIQTLRSKNKLARFVFDEAHCIPTWGSDFRPAYKKLMWVHNSYQSIPFMALTATATKAVQEKIQEQLGMKDVKRFVYSINRPNIKYTVLSSKMSITNITEKIKEEYPGKSGIVYCMTRKECEDTAEKMTLENIPCQVYHAGMPQETLKKTHRLWIEGQVQVIVATNAFGMGIDKSDVRFIFHLHMPKSVEEYFQECGRAGRDGHPCECTLIYNFEDAITWMTLVGSAKKNNTFICNTTYVPEDVKDMVKYSENVSECKRVLLLRYFGEDTPEMCSPSCCSNYIDKNMYNQINVASEVRSVVMLLTRNELNVTVKQVTEILKGSKQKALTNKGFQNLKHFGMMKKLSRETIMKFISSLYIHGYLELEAVKNAHKLVHYVRPGGNESCFSDDFKFIVPSIMKEKEKDFMSCKEKLIALVNKVSYALGIEKEAIIDSEIIIRLALHLPKDKTEMLNIPGITLSKYMRYGELLLDITEPKGYNRHRQRKN